MICRHEQVVTADVAAGVERWPFGSDGSGQGVPLQLLIMPEVPPLLESSLMYGQLHLLPGSTRKRRPGFRPEETLSVPVVKCDVAH